MFIVAAEVLNSVDSSLKSQYRTWIYSLLEVKCC